MQQLRHSPRHFSIQRLGLSTAGVIALIFAGMTGAYGNVGSVVYLTVLSLVSYQVFFMVIAATAVVGFFALFFLKEPEGVIIEEMPDGSFAQIKVS